MALDFSKLDRLAYRGFEDEEQAAEKDRLVEQGFTILEGEKTPFDASAQSETATAMPTQQHPSKRQLNPFKSIDGTRDYRKLYRIACNFHEKYNSPPMVSKDSEEYFRYWQCLTDDMIAIIAANDKDPFLAAMLRAIYEELERDEDAACVRQNLL